MIADSHNRRRPKRDGWTLFEAESAYADGIFHSAIGDTARCIRALERAVEISPDYAPAVLALGSVEYQRKYNAKGRRLLLSLVSMLDDTPDRSQIIDAAGDFLIQSRDYADGFELYRAAVRRFPDVAVFHQGKGCGAAHMGELQEAVAASRHALELEPDNQQFVNDLGWSLSGSCRKRWRRLSAPLSWTPPMSLRARIYAFAIRRSLSVEGKKPVESSFLRACLRPPRGPA
jgi:tetratricopeptide (TPR) repeat protein